MLRFDKLTVKAQEALQAAQDIAEKGGQQQLEPLHLLAALAAQRDGVVPPLLNRLGVHLESLSGEITELLERLPKVSGAEKERCCMDRGGNGIPPFPSRSVRRCVRTQAVRARSLCSGLFDRVGPP